MSPSYEKNLYRRGYRTVAGVDEVGRGSLAGPVTACAVVILQPSKLSVRKVKSRAAALLGDSKKLTRRQREKVFEYLEQIPYIQ